MILIGVSFGVTIGLLVWREVEHYMSRNQWLKEKNGLMMMLSDLQDRHMARDFTEYRIYKNQDVADKKETAKPEPDEAWSEVGRIAD